MRGHLETLERLLAVPAADLDVALTYACDLVAEALRADKVDAFLYDRTRDSLVALGSSNQPLSMLQRQHGLDVLPVCNGGRTVSVYQTGKTFFSGALHDDPDELRGRRDALAIRSEIGVVLDVGGSRRGMLMIASQKPDTILAPVFFMANLLSPSTIRDGRVTMALPANRACNWSRSRTFPEVTWTRFASWAQHQPWEAFLTAPEARP